MVCVLYCVLCSSELTDKVVSIVNKWTVFDLKVIEN